MDIDLGHLLDALPALVWTSRPDGRAEFLGKGWLDYTGLTREEAVGEGWTRAVHPEDAPGLLAGWNRILAAGRLGEQQARLRRHDGVYRWFLFRGCPMPEPSGAVRRWCGINFDIEDRVRAEKALKSRETEAKVAEDALAKARADLTHVARVMALSAITASIAHEVNQPLTGIITNANAALRMLVKDSPDLDIVRNALQRTLRDGNRAAEVIQRLRAMFKRTPPALGPVDLNDAAREVLALSSTELRHRSVTPSAELADNLPLVTGDRVQLQQVILNLILNAADAMSGVADENARRLKLTTAIEGSKGVSLSIRDGGIGIEPDKLERLFDTFYTTKSDGMGVGLSISRSIIENHDGRLWATTNADGTGATFTFWVPSAEPSAPESSGVYL